MQGINLSRGVLEYWGIGAWGLSSLGGGAVRASGVSGLDCMTWQISSWVQFEGLAGGMGVAFRVTCQTLAPKTHL